MIHDGAARSLINHVLALMLFAALVPAVRAADPFAEGVRTTDPVPGEEQVKSFKLPPGFKIELVAAEPDIQKPMNMAFDTKGRLWVTSSREYPFPAPLDKPARDSIKVLEDFDANGRARKITTFADGLNIPIGLYPYKDGVIAWSIPNIWHFRDTNGDGRADQRDVLFGPLGWERDTHGNQASFRRGFDGWLYITHGFNNNSTIRGRDGSEIKLNSGNTYRIRLDGSRVEQHTWGQVNPFGLCFDPAGNLYSADCHSAPIYELLRGGYYPSFGKPHDGLGYAPTLMEHAHGSTAISGIIFYADDLWPEEFQNNILIGNVMTSRINRDTLLARGSSKSAREEPDFLTTTDPWFRPVDLQLGPDGALYVADFYNRIIGHYEVPLTHPGRDRERGRIWKISYTGKPLRALPNFSRSEPAQLLSEFRSPSLSRRILAMNELQDRLSGEAAVALRENLQRKDLLGTEIVHSLWGLQRLKELDGDTLRRFARHADRDVRVHVMRILSEEADFGSLRQSAALQALKDADPLAQRAAAEALGLHPEPEAFVRPLLGLLERAPAEDVQLRHAVRMALRNNLRDGGSSILNYQRYKGDELAIVADLCLAIPTEDAASFLVKHVQSSPKNGRSTEFFRHAARYCGEADMAALSKFIQEHFAGADDQLALFQAIQAGSAQRGLAPSAEFRDWGAALAAELLASADAASTGWRNLPAPGRPVSANPWFLQSRPSSDGDKSSLFLCSLPPGGEALTGILRSGTFAAPARLAFFAAGHDGPPGNPPQGNNLVRLVSASSGQVLAQSAAPRNDIAQFIEWDLAAHAGQQARLEIVDADTGSAYAWIAAGRFQPDVAPLPAADPSRGGARLQAAAEIARTLKLAPLMPAMEKLLVQDSIEPGAQAAMAQALVSLEPSEARAALAPALSDASLPAPLRQRIAQAVAAGRGGTAADLLGEILHASPARLQLQLAQSLAGSISGASTLLGLIEKGQASPRTLLDKGVRDKFAAFDSAELRERTGKLTQNLEPASEALQKQIDAKRAAHTAAKASATAGAEVFTRACAACHQIGGKGAIIGPQLDGIGGRGLERILEDILDPNRNVDVSFRAQVMVLKDGDVVSGLFRREEGELLVFADSTGKELTVPKNQITSRRDSETSLMPANFGDALPEQDFQDLLAYLLANGPAPSAK